MIYGLIWAKRGVIFHFNRLLSQKRLANMATGHYNAGLEFYCVFESLSKRRLCYYKILKCMSIGMWDRDEKERF